MPQIRDRQNIGIDAIFDTAETVNNYTKMISLLKNNKFVRLDKKKRKAL